MLVTMAWFVLWLGFVVEAVLLIYIAWDFLSYINKIEPKEKIKEKFLEEGLTSTTDSKKDFCSTYKAVNHYSKSLRPYTDNVLKKYGWTQNPNDLWSNKDHTNCTFEEAISICGEENQDSITEDMLNASWKCLVNLSGNKY